MFAPCLMQMEVLQLKVYYNCYPKYKQPQVYLKLFCEGLLPGATAGQRMAENSNIGSGQLIQ